MMRELVILGTASQVPTRYRNHNAYFLRFDDQGFLFDPGEGAQRQMQFAGLAVSDITRLCVTHFHGDHALGLPGILQRMSLDDVPHEVVCHFPGEHEDYFERLRFATPHHARAKIATRPATGERTYELGNGLTLTVAPLDHGMPCQGYRIDEPDGVRMLPEKLAAAGIKGPDISRLRAEGRLGEVKLEDVSVAKPGQSFAFVMDTRRCPGAERLAADADLLVIEATFLDSEAEQASQFGHLTARRAARLAADAGVRELVLTHFSQRYPIDQAPARYLAEAAEEFDGPIHIAEDLMRIPFPKRATP
ncbi:ribonuclease Z [Catenulispora sp. NF23]|uniref:ribonuclease Z n=1 Tax=Catenulispora pinistramenti TaxID=2705254 RepID=UPI001BA69081|nr:ribonuclease Z [Catenulispora pinistramenti]MBS2532582.1 ribonuclease Z [Catenulispora pinistramenti]